jgi:toxin CptA
VYTLMREIELKPSRRLGLLMLGMAALALTAIWLADLPAGIRLSLGMGVIGATAWRWGRASVRGVLRLVADGRLQCRDGQGEWRDIEVQADSLVIPALIVLRYRTAADRRTRSLTLLPDSAAADDLRRLRASLRWTRRTRSDTASRDGG